MLTAFLIASLTSIPGAYINHTLREQMTLHVTLFLAILNHWNELSAADTVSSLNHEGL